MPKLTRVFSVDSIQLALTKSNPPQLMVTAIGHTATTGWNDISLVPLEDELSPDGILDLEFVGAPPQEVFVPYLVPAIAHFVWKENVDRVIGVKVDGRSNSLTQLMHQAPVADRSAVTIRALGEGNGPSATSLAAGRGAFPPTTEIVGEEGGVVTFWLGEHPSLYFAEHMSLPIAEQLSNHFAESGAPLRDPWEPMERGGTNAFGAR
jgi:hypothetical protein